ncbi:MAG: hypothetical protein A4E64_01285 [Syntrophorhabdus sp. PtaU1.Bin058]|nr:MAG: hypothetical protein A4E64_01285 [Syntrophorhabdus sp. PtaU1.Bin058]
MKGSNCRPCIILALTITILAFVSLLRIEGNFGSVAIKNIDLFSSISKSAAPAKAVREPVPGTDPSDATEKKAQADGVSGIIDPDMNKIILNNKNNQGSLEYFFDALYRAEEYGGKVRIAYFGDSIIEGDLISQDLRKNLQAQFGGKGVGFVPITSVAPRSRNTINHTFSNNWQVAALHPKFNERHMPGISGFTFLPTSDTFISGPDDSGQTKAYKYSWVEYEASKLFENTNSFSVVKLYYGPVTDFAFIKYVIDNDAARVVNLPRGEMVRELAIKGLNQARKIKISFFAKDSAEIYGVSFEENGGVYVDNFSIRGYSGLSLNKLPGSMLADFDSFLKYKLIIIHYGVNISGFTTKPEFIWYRNRMIEVVEHLKGAFPRASFLIVSVNDIAVKQGTELTTKPSIPLLVEAQRQIARQTGAAFWNLYEAMGGADSMASWVKGKNPLASKDCIHFSHRGGKKVADLLTKALLKEYKAYKAKRIANNNGKYNQRNGK